MATVHYEILLKGNEDILCAYIHGFLAGKNIKEGIIFGNKEPFEIHEIRELIRYHGGICHFICRAGIRQTLLSAVHSAPESYSFEVVQQRKISSASFKFKFETFNEEVAGKLKKIFDKIPAGVTVVDFEPEEVIDPKAKGIEVYAPAHDYRYAGEGKATGNVEALLDFHRALSESEFIEMENIELEY